MARPGGGGVTGVGVPEGGSAGEGGGCEDELTEARSETETKSVDRVALSSKGGGGLEGERRRAVGMCGGAVPPLPSYSPAPGSAAGPWSSSLRDVALTSGLSVLLPHRVL